MLLVYIIQGGHTVALVIVIHFLFRSSLFLLTYVWHLKTNITQRASLEGYCLYLVMALMVFSY